MIRFSFLILSMLLIVEVAPWWVREAYAVEDSTLTSAVQKADAGKVEAAYEQLLKQTTEEIAKSDSSTGKEKDFKEKLHVRYLALGNWAMQLKKWPEARGHFELSAKFGVSNAAHIQYLLAHSYKEEGDDKKAIQNFQKVFTMNPAQNIVYETRNEMSDIAFKMGQLWQARGHLQPLERRWRGTAKYPEILWHLMTLEFKDNRRHLACKWARKLYARYPAHELVSSWSVDLHENKFEGRAIGCTASRKELRERIRHLRLSGLEEVARKEIDILKARARPSEKVEVDMLLADYLESQGYPDDALKVLMPYYEERKRDLNFLNLFGKISARAGEFQAAIGVFFNVYKMSPRSKFGRNALFTSAFLSYQIQDYDGAVRRFNEIVEKYRGSSSARDARWHLAWLQYLRGNYAEAEKSYKALAAEKIFRRRRMIVRPFSDDRTKYWLAQSLIKQNKNTEATKLLTPLAQDKAMGYYSLLARTRLKELPAPLPIDTRQLTSVGRFNGPTLLPAAPTVNEAEQVVSVTNPAVIFSANGQVETTTDDIEENIETPDNLSVAEESEDSEATDGAETEESSGPKLEAAGEDATAASEVPVDTDEAEKVQVTKFSDPKLQLRFQSANNLIALGMHEWARWELYEIERRTSNKTYLKMLMEAYTKIGSYNRSAYISEIFFSTERQKMGFKEGREFWEYNFPHAYKADVDKFAKKFGVPVSMVLAIMRAESQFNKEALSPVGARGLMQIMPYTATHIANLLGENYVSDQSLFNPETNIRLGTRYLSRLLKKFQGQIPLAAAGYNAGPHRVNSWLNTFGNLDMDEFIEHVPFVETRNYMKKVARNYAVYDALYSQPSSYKWLTEPVPVKVSERPSPRENWDSVE